MKTKIYLIAIICFLFSCKSAIKNENPQVEVEEGTEITSEQASNEGTDSMDSETISKDNRIGSWVGYFERDDESVEDKTVYVDEGFIWNRENKINISIDDIQGNQVIGHSVVAGNDRPFVGSVTETSDGVFEFQLKEPGDDKYDGEFRFTIQQKEMKGTWKAYKKIDIQKRKYSLKKRTFSYNPNIMLEQAKAYVDWSQVMEKKEKFDMGNDEFDEWVTREFATATNKIYEINASNTVLEKGMVENLKKGDLTIIRNTIYARHGYSFKNRPLRVFFDAQSWYIPVHANIKEDFTDIEKKNIQLMLQYEKNASEYYDYFGRG